MKRVLSISGGGMRGVIPGRMLVEIERRTGRPIAEGFDLIAGTSTGGILACLATTPRRVSAVEAMRFYYESGPRIFRQGWRKALSMGGLLQTKYGNAVLSDELHQCLGGYRLGEARTRTMVTTLEARGRAEMVKSWEAEWRNLPFVSAALMTSAAQTYFPQASAMGGFWLDGGNVRNAPMACAAFEAGQLWGFSEPITLVHLGTGRKLRRNQKRLPNGGALGWVTEIFDCTTNGDDSYDDYFCKGLEKFIPGFTYHRLDVDLEEFPAMDDARKETLDDLVDQTSGMLAREWKTLDAICAGIAERKVAA